MKALALLFLSIILLSCKTSVLTSKREGCLLDSSKAERIIEFLTRTVPEYKIKAKEDFSFEKDNCFIKRVGIYDLTNSPVINTFTNRSEFKLENSHIYHFYVLDPQLSFSHILYIDRNGQFTFFESINCKNRGNTLQEVISYLTHKLATNPQKDQIIERVKNYRNYYRIGAIDDIYVPLQCDCESCE
ncbi:hypothetical protein QNI19_26210 [Cytophagaceae bacterium DM2B3-1]|uniref:DUF4468 domain-containing protein n=1 Tax=Xanthocytophaga flava TaxID=3048013 RepID=A0ABT7CRU1_9BACT|nr:hypothetical protein [Xanthocytophaga flavus]MDJ1468676.1 hypothetical protein [Xanthocytophaga flavus]MDJ1496457.1 hypothetical protein [Xanthocytophaga flavus]